MEKFYVNKKERKYQFWQPEPLAIRIFSSYIAEQKLDYLHLNPLQSHWNLAKDSADYLYSSAQYYEIGLSEFKFLTHYKEHFG